MDDDEFEQVYEQAWNDGYVAALVELRELIVEFWQTPSDDG